MNSRGTTMSEWKGKKAMAGNDGEESSSVDPELGLRQACVASLEEKRMRFLSEDRGKHRKTPSIWKVRSQLRNKDSEAYEPQLVSIGPFHHGKELSPMEELKLENLCYILTNFPGTLKDFVKQIFALLPRARAEYSENIELSDDKFAEMLVIDGCFLVGLLMPFHPIEMSPLFSQVYGTYNFIWRDLMLIENQIPIFVVRELSDMISGRMSPWPIVPAVLKWIPIYIPREKYPLEKDCRHLLHLKCLSLNPNLCLDETPRQSYWQRRTFLVNKLVRWIFAPFLGLLYLILFRGSKKSRKLIDSTTIPSASELYESGVKFQRITILNQGYHQVVPKASFRYGTLALPWLYIDDYTCSDLRNLVAFEQYFKEVDPHFSCYRIFFDNLINTADDVALLRRSGVLENGLGSDLELADIFNSIGKEIFTDYSRDPYQKLGEDIRNFCEIPHHRWRANLSQKYFSNPWTFLSVMAAATLIVFPITQTIFTIYPRK